MVASSLVSPTMYVSCLCIQLHVPPCQWIGVLFLTKMDFDGLPQVVLILSFGKDHCFMPHKLIACQWSFSMMNRTFVYISTAGVNNSGCQLKKSLHISPQRLNPLPEWFCAGFSKVQPSDPQVLVHVYIANSWKPCKQINTYMDDPSCIHLPFLSYN